MVSGPEEYKAPEPRCVSQEDMGAARVALQERKDKLDKPVTFPLPQITNQHARNPSNTDKTLTTQSPPLDGNNERAMQVFSELSTGLSLKPSLESRVEILAEDNRTLRNANSELNEKVNTLETKISQQETQVSKQEERLKKLEDIMLVNQEKATQSSPPALSLISRKVKVRTPQSTDTLKPCSRQSSNKEYKNVKTTPQKRPGDKQIPTFAADLAHSPYLPPSVRQEYISDVDYTSLINLSNNFSQVAKVVASAMFSVEDRLNCKIEPWGDSPVLDQAKVKIMKQLIFDMCKIKEADESKAWKWAKHVIYKHTRAIRHDVKVKKGKE